MEVTIVSHCPLYIHRRPGATCCVCIMNLIPSQGATCTKIWYWISYNSTPHIDQIVSVSPYHLQNYATLIGIIWMEVNA